jgi:hypothetical protein
MRFFGTAASAALLCLVGGAVHAQDTPPPESHGAREAPSGESGVVAAARAATTTAGLGYRFGILYKVSAATVEGASSDAFQNTTFNTLFGFGIENGGRMFNSVVFNVTNRAVVDTADAFGRKYLLPTQTGFVFNIAGVRYWDAVDPVFYNPDDASDTRLGWYFGGGFTPVEYRLPQDRKTTGMIGYGAAGVQVRFPHFRAGDQGTIGMTLRLGPTFRTVLSGLNDTEFWTTVRGNGTRRRSDLGLEAQFQFDIGKFRPTVMYTYFNRGGNIAEFSGSKVSFLFDVGDLVGLDQRKEAKASQVVSYLKRRVIQIRDRGAGLADEELNVLTGLLNSLKGIVADTDLRDVYDVFEDANQREIAEIRAYERGIQRLRDTYNSKTTPVDKKANPDFWAWAAAQPWPPVESPFGATEWNSAGLILKPAARQAEALAALERTLRKSKVRVRAEKVGTPDPNNSGVLAPNF